MQRIYDFNTIAMCHWTYHYNSFKAAHSLGHIIYIYIYIYIYMQIKRQMLAHSRSMGEVVADYVRDVSKLLSRIAAYQDKNTEPHLQAQ